MLSYRLRTEFRRWKYFYASAAISVFRSRFAYPSNSTLSNQSLLNKLKIDMGYIYGYQPAANPKHIYVFQFIRLYIFEWIVKKTRK